MVEDNVLDFCPEVGFYYSSCSKPGKILQVEGGGTVQHKPGDIKIPAQDEA